MRPALLTATGAVLAPNVVEQQDYYVMWPSTDGYEGQQPLGIPPVMIMPVAPPVGVQLGAPQEFGVAWARRARSAQEHLSYRIGSLERGFFWTDPILVGRTLELQPIYNQRDLLHKKFYAATVQEQTNRVRTSNIPSGQYADTKCRLLNEVQRHFLEPVIDDGVTWQLWTTDEVHEALELRIYRFLMETGLLRTESDETSVPTATIPQDAIDIRRVEWRSGASSRALQRMDSKQADLGYPGWDSTSSSPVGYVEEPSPEDSMLLKTCPPASTGSITMRYVPAPGLNTGSPCEALPIPRMFTWAVKWGLIADLLKKEGEANDPVRAEAALQIYELGVKLARLLLGTKL